MLLNVGKDNQIRIIKVVYYAKKKQREFFQVVHIYSTKFPSKSI